MKHNLEFVAITGAEARKYWAATLDAAQSHPIVIIRRGRPAALLTALPVKACS